MEELWSILKGKIDSYAEEINERNKKVSEICAEILEIVKSIPREDLLSIKGDLAEHLSRIDTLIAKLTSIEEKIEEGIEIAKIKDTLDELLKTLLQIRDILKDPLSYKVLRNFRDMLCNVAKKLGYLDIVEKIKDVTDENLRNKIKENINDAKRAYNSVCSIVDMFEKELLPLQKVTYNIILHGLLHASLALLEDVKTSKISLAKMAEDIEAAKEHLQSIMYSTKELDNMLLKVKTETNIDLHALSEQLIEGTRTEIRITKSLREYVEKLNELIRRIENLLTEIKDKVYTLIEHSKRLDLNYNKLASLLFKRSISGIKEAEHISSEMGVVNSLMKSIRYEPRIINAIYKSSSTIKNSCDGLLEELRTYTLYTIADNVKSLSKEVKKATEHANNYMELLSSINEVTDFEEVKNRLKELTALSKSITASLINMKNLSLKIASDSLRVCPQIFKEIRSKMADMTSGLNIDIEREREHELNLLLEKIMELLNILMEFLKKRKALWDNIVAKISVAGVLNAETLKTICDELGMEEAILGQELMAMIKENVIVFKVFQKTKQD